VVVDCSAHGGTGELVYSLGSEVAGFAIDRKTGQVSIDTARLSFASAINAILSRLEQTVMRDIRSRENRPTTMPVSLSDRLDELQKQYASKYQKLTGKVLKGFVVAVPLGVSVRDSEQQIANQLQYVLLEIPRDEVGKAVQAREEQARAMRASHPGKGMYPATQPYSAGYREEVAQMRSRIAALEQENRELRAQVELLKEILMGRRGTTTRPAGP